MQSRLFRYEIDRALVNPVFQATDPATGQPVFLYEWTPPVEERVAAKLRLEEVAGELACEVFTADASLYLAAPTREAAGKALLTLQARGLFPGDWLERPRSLAVVEPVYLPEPALAAPFTRSSAPATVPYTVVPASPVFSGAGRTAQKKKSPAVGCFAFFFGFIVLVVGGLITHSFSGGLLITVIYIAVVIGVRRNSTR